MRRSVASRAVTSCALVALMVASSLPGPVSVAAAKPMRDGDPTPEACRALGFQPSPHEDGRVARAYRSRAMPAPMMAPPPPPPPAPPPPPPPPPAPSYLRDSSVAETVVTGSRVTRPQAAPNAQVGVIGYIAPGSQRPQDTERYPNAVANPVKRVADEPVSTFSIDVDTAAYANVRRFLHDGARPPKDAVRVEELVNYFDYHYPRPTSASEPFKPFVAVTPSPWSRDRQIVHIGLQGYDIPRAQQPPLNLVFLIDTSGSMSPEDRLPLAIKSLNTLIGQLRPQDHVAMVAYAGSAGAVLGPTAGDQKLKMRCALQALHSGGSTAGGAGLSLAYALAEQGFRKDSVNRVILMTDGDFNVGLSDPNRLKDFVAEKRKTGVYLSVYGFGRGNYNDTMMQALAQNGNGTAAYVDTLDEARKLFRTDFSGSVFPIADDVKIQVEFNPARVAEYRLIGYETRLLNREDFNNDRVDAGEVGSGASVTALYEITPVGALPSSDELRYGDQRSPRAAAAGVASEIAFLKVRYKLPGQANSHLMQQPIAVTNMFGSVAQAPESTRWAIAVAGYGQRLRNDPWMDEAFGWDQIAGLAQGARGGDDFGQRAEFVQLVRSAKDARGVGE